METKNQINLFLLILITILLSCNNEAYNSQILIHSDDIVKINKKVLLGAKITSLSNILKDLKPIEKEIYTKPEYIIEFKNNDSTLLLSIFREERFIYKGNYLDAWEDRMKGNKSNGFKLSSMLLSFLEKHK